MENNSFLHRNAFHIDKSRLELLNWDQARALFQKLKFRFIIFEKKFSIANAKKVQKIHILSFTMRIAKKLDSVK